MKLFKLVPSVCLLFIVFITLPCCVREEIIPYNNYGSSKIVVMGFISTGDRVNIYIGKSMPFGKPSYQPSDFVVNNAIATISNESGLVQTLSLVSANSGIYSCSQANFPILASNIYTLKVNVANFNEIIATTTVPYTTAKWEKITLSKIENNYYLLSGWWDALQNDLSYNYGVNIITSNKNLIDRTNEGITQLNTIYTVKREVFLPNSNSLQALLLTRDKAMGDFSRKSDLTLDVIENLSSAGFTDIISGFKGVIPDAGNIKGGIGVFGSYLKDVKTINY